MNKNTIIKKGGKPGKTLAVFVGIHGDEKIGVMALSKLLPNLEIEYGKVYFVYANPKAITKNTRKISVDLNRSFSKEKIAYPYEEKRVRELMKILNESDALLDVHAFTDPLGTPFIICENDSINFAKTMNYKFITSGWDKFDVGSSDGYMRSLGKSAVCVEVGPKGQEDKYMSLAMDSILAFLTYHGAIPSKNKTKNNKKIIRLKIYRRIFRKHEDFKFLKTYKTCGKIKSGVNFLQDGKKIYANKFDTYIIFPNKNAKIGNEACLLAREVKNTK